MTTTDFYYVMATILPLLATLAAFLWRYWTAIRQKIQNRNESKDEKIDGNAIKRGNFGFPITSQEKSAVAAVSQDMGNRIGGTSHRRNSGATGRGADLYMHDSFRDVQSDQGVGQDNDDEQGLVDLDNDDDPHLHISSENKLSKRLADQGTGGFYLPELNELREKLEKSEMDIKAIDSVPGKFKKSKFIALNKQVEESLTDEQKEEEAEVRRHQLEEIFKLMKEQEAKLGIQSEEDMSEQLKLYAL